MTIASLIALTILALLSLFQLALALGAPLGQFAWGGQYRILPRKFRRDSVAATILYVGMAAVIISKWGVEEIIPSGPFLNTVTILLFIYTAFAVGLNWFSQSKKERAVMTPVALILAVCMFVIAFN